tara:strand:- start:3161 stop:5215 length:2055 start_codon:yes stop_codon:yes gene_type:complete
MISALALGVLLLPVFKPPWMELKLTTFVDFFRRYWLHISMLFMIYNAKDGLDQVDRILMANTGLDMTPWIYAIEGDLVLNIQNFFEAEWLTVLLTHFYVAGFMFICYVSVFYFAYFDDRWISDRVTLTIAWVYIFAIPFYLFFNVRVTGDYIPEMETLAYSLNPEIADWFRRIDPFTNCMPSLHIGVPFSVWLCLKRFDEDNRWALYRKIVLVYTLLTCFTIIYLGIHWILDIIGGMLVAAAAVSMAEKTSDSWWKVFDERTINSRLVTLLTNPKKALKIISNKSTSLVKSYVRPKAKQTGVLVVVLMLLVVSVITWDLTHQSLSADGAEAPEGASAADGWLVTMDNRSEYGALILIQDISQVDSEAIQVVQPIMTLNSSYSLIGNNLVMANDTLLFLVDVNYPNIVLLEYPIDNPQQVLITSTNEQDVILILSDDKLEAISLTGVSIPLGITADDILFVSANGLEYAYVTTSQPTTVHIGRIGTLGSISYEVNATASAEQDLVLEQWGTPVDMANASITQIEFDSSFIVSTVNVSTVDRLILLNRGSNEQWIVGDGKYSALDPSLSNGILAWAGFDHLNPVLPLDEYLDGEIYYLNLTTNYTHTLTSDELNQWGPIVLDNHLVFFEESEEGAIIKIHSWEPELKTYSNIILQIGTILGIILVFIHLTQRQQEAKVVRNLDEEE